MGFEKDKATSIGGLAVGNDDWHGRIEAGVTIQVPGGLSVRATGAYEGLGDKDLQLYQGQLSVSLPPN